MLVEEPVSLGIMRLCQWAVWAVRRSERVRSVRAGDEFVELRVDRLVERHGQHEAQLRIDLHCALCALLRDLTAGERAARQLHKNSGVDYSLFIVL